MEKISKKNTYDVRRNHRPHLDPGRITNIPIPQKHQHIKGSTPKNEKNKKLNKKNYSAGFLFKNCVIKVTKTKPAIIVPKITQEYSIAILIYKHLKFLFFLISTIIILFL